MGIALVVIIGDFVYGQPISMGVKKSCLAQERMVAKACSPCCQVTS